jgi:TetR/AcrR family fatty acid metabolism transcriptional regulator
VLDVVNAGRAYMIPRIFAETTGPATLRVYIESNLSFIGEHRNYMAAVLDIARNGAIATDGGQRADGREIDVATHLLEELLTRLQSEGELREDFDRRVMAVSIRAAIDSVSHRLVRDPNLDIDHYAREIAAIFDRATRVTD